MPQANRPSQRGVAISQLRRSASSNHSEHAAADVDSPESIVVMAIESMSTTVPDSIKVSLIDAFRDAEQLFMTSRHQGERKIL
eukprot:2535493-Amphidinium_carterae.1